MTGVDALSVLVFGKYGYDYRYLINIANVCDEEIAEMLSQNRRWEHDTPMGYYLK